NNNVNNNMIKPVQNKEDGTTEQVSKPDSSDLKDSVTTNQVSSSSSDNGVPSSNVDSKRRITKKSSSEIRRWSLFGTWSSSSTNLLESYSDGENSKKAVDDSDLNLKSDAH